MSLAMRNNYVYLVLLSSWIIINFYTANAVKISTYTELSIIFLCNTLALVIIKLALNLLLRIKPNKDLPMLLGITFMLFFYSNICNFFGSKLGIVQAYYIWLILFGLSVFLIYKTSNYDFLQVFSKYLILGVFIISLLNLTQVYFDIKKQAPSVLANENKQEQIYQLKNKPNIYFFLVDAYARDDTLLETTGFNNSEFLEKLDKNDFIVASKSKSNYHFTSASLSATFNMKLHDKVKNKEEISYYSQMHESLKGNNRVRKILRANDYFIFNIPAHWHQMDCYGYENKCIKGINFDIYKNFISTSALAFLSKYMPNRYVSVENVKEAVSYGSNKPKFVFAHFAQVHDAIFDKNGNFHSVKDPIYSNKEDAADYVYSVKKLNSMLLNIIDYIKKKDPGAIIIIQADHGPTYLGNQPKKEKKYSSEFRLRNKEDYKYTFGILSAVSIPKNIELTREMKDYIANDISPVNLFRVIFSLLSKENISLENNSSFFLYQDNKLSNYNFGDIEDFIN